MSSLFKRILGSLKGHYSHAFLMGSQVHGGFITVSKIGVVGWRGKKTDPDAQFHLEAHPDGGSNRWMDGWGWGWGWGWLVGVGVGDGDGDGVGVGW